MTPEEQAAAKKAAVESHDANAIDMIANDKYSTYTDEGGKSGVEGSPKPTKEDGADTRAARSRRPVSNALTGRKSRGRWPRLFSLAKQSMSSQTASCGLSGVVVRPFAGCSLPGRGRRRLLKTGRRRRRRVLHLRQDLGCSRGRGRGRNRARSGQLRARVPRGCSRIFLPNTARDELNPDVLCNNEIVQGLSRVARRGRDRAATTRTRRRSRRAVRAIDATKDQSYFLHRLAQELLRPAMFPVEN
jgi:hypothetical protein